MLAEKPFKILLVDDDPDFIEMLRRELVPYRAKVTVMDSVEDSIGLFRSEFFDVVVTDLRFPGLDGAEFLAWAKKNLKREIPKFVFVSGQPFLTIDEVFEMGVDSIFFKPCSVSALAQRAARLAQLSDILGSRKSERFSIFKSFKLGQKSFPLENLSMGGCFVQCSVPKGESFDFELNIKGGPFYRIRGVGEVKWTRSTETPGVGIQFRHIESGAKTQLRELINSLKTSAFSGH